MNDSTSIGSNGSKFERFGSVETNNSGAEFAPDTCNNPGADMIIHAREVRNDTFRQTNYYISKRKKARPANWVVISTSTPPNPFNQARTNK